MARKLKKKKGKLKKRIRKKIKSEPTKRSECPECGSTNIIFMKSSDEIVCQDCGAIFAKLAPEEEEKFEKVREQK